MKDPKNGLDENFGKKNLKSLMTPLNIPDKTFRLIEASYVEATDVHPSVESMDKTAKILFD